MDATVASEPISRVVKTMPWDLADLIAYLLLGVLNGFVGLAAFYGVERVASVVEQHALLAGAATIMLGYPIGVMTLGVGRLFRELLRRIVPNKTRPGRGDGYVDQLSDFADSVIGKRLRQDGGPHVPLQHQLRIGVLLAEKYLPGAAVAVNRQNSMFRFFVTLVGGTLLSLLVLEVGALLRLQGAVPGSAASYALWGLAPLAILCVAEYAARNANAVLVEAMADAAAAVSVLLAAEEHK